MLFTRRKRVDKQYFDCVEHFIRDYFRKQPKYYEHGFQVFILIQIRK